MNASSRFNQFVFRMGLTGCWLWGGSTTEGGYGRFRYNGKSCRAHRVAWELTNGPIPTGMEVMHSCDNPPCVNPRHLSLGTVKDNAEDRCRKGRSVNLRGEAHGSSKLTAEQVAEIRKVGNTKTQRELGRLYGVDFGQIGRILRQECWNESTL